MSTDNLRVCHVNFTTLLTNVSSEMLTCVVDRSTPLLSYNSHASPSSQLGPCQRSHTTRPSWFRSSPRPLLSEGSGSGQLNFMIHKVCVPSEPRTGPIKYPLGGQRLEGYIDNVPLKSRYD